MLEQGRPGEVYNIGGSCEKTNLDITRTILNILNKPEDLVRFVKDRPGHDFRYAIDSSKIRSELGWEPKISFEQGLASTIDWYRQNRGWWEQVKSGEYRDFYEKMYGKRIKDSRKAPGDQ